jgi:hypothetical protein
VVRTGASRRLRACLRCLAAAALFGPVLPSSAVRAGEPAQEPGVTALDRFFSGDVLAVDGEKVRLRYDFSKPEHAKDWPEGLPIPVDFRKPGTQVSHAEGRLTLRGSTGVRHRAEWQGDVTVTCTWIPDGTKDLGGFLMSNEVATDYVTYTVVETLFHGWDHKPGGDTGMIKFGAQWAPDRDKGFNGFRYMTLRPLSPPPSAGTGLPVTFGRKGGKCVMTVGSLELESAEPGKRMAIVAPGFYCMDSSFSVDDVTVEGRLARRFVTANHLALRTEAPLVAEAPAGADPAVTAMATAYAAGKESAATLVKAVGDTTRKPPDRGALVDALKKGPRRAAVAALDLLYHGDPVVRAAGLDVVRTLLGKDYGYDPKASAKARAAAVQRLNKDLQEHPELLEGTAG